MQSLSSALKVAMAKRYSHDRVFRADYVTVHKKKIPLQLNSLCAERFGVSLLQSISKQVACSVPEGNQICQRCFKRYKDIVSSYYDFSNTGDSFVSEQKTVNEMNEFIKFFSISSLRLPGLNSQKLRKVYAKVKRKGM